MKSTVAYWLKVTMSGMNLRFTTSETNTLPPEVFWAKIEP